MIIDDELPARQELRFLLQKLPWLAIVGEAEDSATGLDMVLAEHPDLVFLDIAMPQRSGVDLCKELAQLPDPPQVVFATAYHHYAVEAFELCALDYVLKPYHAQRVYKAAHKARLAVAKKHSLTTVRAPLDRLPVRADEKVMLIPYDDIAVAYTDGRDVLVSVKGTVHKCELSLQELEERLQANNFFRTHRSYLVNLDKILEVSPWFSGSYVLKIEGTTLEVPVSRKQVKDFRARVGI
ncbi:MAG: response regulator transcription factor [Peptococcaceae bacterium]|nr:response regulator transcription factor [Peptococcaceae bacterium]MBT9152823.1 Transcriptional regulatory protein YpdB [Bacillota bacterium]